MQTTPSNSVTSNNSMTNKASSTIAREFNSFVGDIEDLIKSTTHLTGEDLNRAKAKLNERIASAKESVDQLSDTVIERARKTAETTNAYVHEQPWNAMGAGAAIGLLVGYLLARRG